jgi:hypothetical protein
MDILKEVQVEVGAKVVGHKHVVEMEPLIQAGEVVEAHITIELMMEAWVVLVLL